MHGTTTFIDSWFDSGSLKGYKLADLGSPDDCERQSRSESNKKAIYLKFTFIIDLSWTVQQKAFHLAPAETVFFLTNKKEQTKDTKLYALSHKNWQNHLDWEKADTKATDL